MDEGHSSTSYCYCPTVPGTTWGSGSAVRDRWQGLTWKDLSDELGQAFHNFQHGRLSQPLIGHMRCVITAKERPPGQFGAASSGWGMRKGGLCCENRGCGTERYGQDEVGSHTGHGTEFKPWLCH